MQEFIKRLVRYYRLAIALFAIARFPRIRKPKPSGLPGELIVSLTSYNKRFHVLGFTLKSLLDQTVKADRTILWLDNDDLASLPADIRKLEKHGLEIRCCEDIFSFKKLVPTVEAYPDAFIVTADDDVYYPPNWLKCLVETYDPMNPAVVATRAHLARFEEDGSAVPYSEWDLETTLTHAPSPLTAIFPTGAGGVLYPPKSLSPEVTNKQAFLDLCRYADDIWFFWMELLNETRLVRTRWQFRLLNWPESQQHGLYIENLLNKRNDVQLKAVESRYGKMGLRLRP